MKSNNLNNKRYIAAILGSVLFLGLFGLIAIFDFSSGQNVDSISLVRNQIIFFVFGFILMILTILWFDVVDKHRLWLFVTAIILLLLPFIFDNEYYGAKRWLIGQSIHTGPWAILFLMPLLTNFITNNNEKKRRKNFYILICITQIINVLLILQPDMPNLVLFNILILILFFRNHKIWKILKFSVIFLSMLILLVCFSYVLNRIYHNYSYNILREFVESSVSYNYKQSIYDYGFQTSFAMKNISAGGLTGLGIGSFSDKYLSSYLINDTISRFILQICCREFGIVGISIIFSLFTFICYTCIKLIKSIQTVFDRELSLIMLLFILIQLILTSVRTFNLLPFMPAYTIPFMGYGFNSLATFFCALGVIFAKAKIYIKS